MPKQSQSIPISISALSDYGWIGGLALNEYVGQKSTYSTQTNGGIDPFRKIGVLQAGYFASTVNSFITARYSA